VDVLINTTGLTPNPSQRKKKASPPTPLQGERGVICYAATKLISEKCSAIARHITPLSPWRGVGGEAFSTLSERQG